MGDKKDIFKRNIKYIIKIEKYYFRTFKNINNKSYKFRKYTHTIWLQIILQEVSISA